MSPTSYRTAPPRIAEENTLAHWSDTCQAEICCDVLLEACLHPGGRFSGVPVCRSGLLDRSQGLPAQITPPVDRPAVPCPGGRAGHGPCRPGPGSGARAATAAAR